jgi:hypothetical protein
MVSAVLCESGEDMSVLHVVEVKGGVHYVQEEIINEKEGESMLTLYFRSAVEAHIFLRSNWWMSVALGVCVLMGVM